MTNWTVDNLKKAIYYAIRMHHESVGVYDHRIANAWVHLNAALKALKEGEVEVVPDLPLRKRGNKPRMVFPIHEGEPSQPVRRRDLERLLKKLLLPLHPRRNRTAVKTLAVNLLTPILG